MGLSVPDDLRNAEATDINSAPDGSVRDYGLLFDGPFLKLQNRTQHQYRKVDNAWVEDGNRIGVQVIDGPDA